MDFSFESSLKTARHALEARLLSELEEKDETFFTGAELTAELLEEKGGKPV